MEQTTKNKYHVKAKLNGKITEVDTDDLKETILSLKPLAVKTKMILTITKDDKICEKLVLPNKVRALFRSSIFLEAFIRQLIFKPNG